MKLKQISVFLENRQGQLSHACRALARAGVNINALSLADTRQFGVLRMLIRDHDRAVIALQADGFVVRVTDVVAVDVPDRPGGLADVLETVEAAGINVEYMYAVTHRTEEKGMMVFRFEDPDGAAALLRDAGFDVVPDAELARRTDTAKD